MTFFLDVVDFVMFPLSYFFGWEVSVDTFWNLMFLNFGLYCLVFQVIFAYWLIFVGVRGINERARQFKDKEIHCIDVSCCLCYKKPWLWTTVKVPFQCKTEHKHVYCLKCLKGYLHGSKHDSTRLPVKCRLCTADMDPKFTM
jgi:hypothetical protein